MRRYLEAILAGIMAALGGIALGELLHILFR